MILSDLSPCALARASKDNLLAFFAFLERSPLANFRRGANTVRWQLPFRFAWYNGVLSSGPPAPDEGAAIREVQAYYRAAGHGSMTWWVSSDGDTDAWARQLTPHGFGYDRNTPAMAIDLAAVPDERLPAGLEIRPVEDDAALRVWTRTFLEGYGLPHDWTDAMHRLMRDLGLGLPMRNYLGCLDGEAVATSNLFIGAGVAGVQYVATLPQMRGRGIGAALTLAPLRDGRSLGYRAGILQSSQMGFNVYRRLGFAKVADIDNFYWTPAAQ